MKWRYTFLQVLVVIILTACGREGADEIFSIEGEDIYIMSGPGNNYDKVINEKATEAFHKTQYAEVDYTVKIQILEKGKDWSKIKVVEPDWMSDSHIGWIPSKYIVKQIPEDTTSILSSSEYEIIKEERNSSIQIFHVLIKANKFDKESVFTFTKRFRNEYCKHISNVFVYDSKVIIPLIGKYPLEGKEYLKMADHLISISLNGSENLKDWYPYQDFQYAKYGGKNWRKTPVKFH